MKDDEDSLKRLRQTASDLGIAFKADQITPSHDQQDLKNRLAMLSGSSFDREYLDAMVHQQQNQVQNFESEANSQSGTSGTGREKPEPSGAEPQPQALARELLPTVEQHLQETKSLQQQIGGR